MLLFLPCLYFLLLFLFLPWLVSTITAEGRKEGREGRRREIERGLWNKLPNMIENH